MAAKSNNFDAIRLAAALTVLFSHSYPLTNTASEPFEKYLGGYGTGGGLAVWVFFVLSGFLVLRSAERHDTWTYLRSRAHRILPGLAVCLLVSAFLIGPFFTVQPLREYLLNHAVWRYVEGFLLFNLAPTIPGVFADNPLSIVNGSLWTLPIEAAFYLVLPVLTALGLLRGPVLFVLTAASIVGYIAAGAFFGLNIGQQGGYMFRAVPWFSGLQSASFFLIGACFWSFRQNIRLNAGVAICCVLLLEIAPKGHLKDAVLLICLPYLVFYVGLGLPRATDFSRRIGDLSYGTYLYAFPVQQSVVAVFGPAIGPLVLSAIATPITLGFALLSWHLVERPSLRLRYSGLSLAKPRPAVVPRTRGRGQRELAKEIASGPLGGPSQ